MLLPGCCRAHSRVLAQGPLEWSRGLLAPGEASGPASAGLQVPLVSEGVVLLDLVYGAPVVARPPAAAVVVVAVAVDA